MRCVRCGSEVSDTRSGISVCSKPGCRLLQWYVTGGGVAYRSGPNHLKLISGSLIIWDEVEV